MFENYYTAFYNIPMLGDDSPATPDSPTVRYFIDETILPTLDTNDTADLDHPFSSEKLQQVIKKIPTNKTPGSDGYTNKFYKIFHTPLSPFLLRFFNSILPDNPFPSRTLEVHITLIPKPDTDHTLCRPISLLGTENGIQKL